MILEAVCAVLGDLLERITQLLVGKCVAVGKKIAKIVKYLLDGLYIALVAVDEKFVAACADIYIEERFEIFDVLILNAEKRVQSLRGKF